MVDVWNELGKALGRALKPLAEIGTAIWTAFGAASDDLIKGFMVSAEDLSDAVVPTVDRLLSGAIDGLTASLGEDSPPEEIQDAIKKMVDELMKVLEKESETKGESLPTVADMAVRKAALISKVMIMYATTHALSMALDASQPIKDWGFKTATMDMMYQFQMSEVVGPIIQAPIWASLVMPMRMRYKSQYPYEVPGTGVLPYLMAKNIVTDEEYKLNMSYHAFDGKWSDAMLANTWRYPGFGDMRTMIHRGIKTWPEAREALAMNLTESVYLDAYESLIPSIPGVSDLVRFAVREAYPDATTFTEHYAKMSEWMAKLGYDQYFADAFWDAHWIIPTISQADEMLHRGDITVDQHTGLYILNDIRPQDIDALRALTWKLPGRIESRWMFRWGEIEVTDLRDYLVKDGLDPIYADSVATAMAKNQFLSDINRQIANIKADYARGYSVETSLRGDLSALGMRSEIVEYHVLDALDDRARSIADGELSTLRSQYARGALPMADIIASVEKIIIDDVSRTAWLARLPTAKQVMIMEETFGAEINRLVANIKYDYVRGYVTKEALVARLTLLDIPTMVIDFHVMDAEEDRARGYNDKRLGHIEEGYIDDLIDWTGVEDMAKEILVDEEGLGIWLDGVWLNKHLAKRE